MSKFYSQKAYPTTQLGSCKEETISKSGCFLVSFVNLLRTLNIITTPESFNKIAYKSGCLANASYWAGLYKLNYIRTNINPEITCIMETNFWKKYGVPQHFCLIRKDGKIIDPLDKNPDWKKNGYPIVSYRVFTKRKEPKIEPVIPPIDPPLTPTPIPPENAPEPVETPVETIVPKPQIPLDARETQEPSLLENIINWLIKLLK